MMTEKICFLSIDVEEDLRDDGEKSFLGVENLEKILAVFRQFGAPATLFVTGEVLDNYPELVKKWAVDCEIACHGYFHQPLSQLPLAERERGLANFIELYRNLLGRAPAGFRAVQNVIDNEQFALLEKLDFLYDSSVVPDYPPFKKYVGYKGPAPLLPYHPLSENHLQKGNMKILEIPLTPHLLGIPLVGTWLRRLRVRFFKLLFSFYQPKFISFSMHSWDAVPGGALSAKNRGQHFVEQLAAMLEYLKKKNYQFLNGEMVYEKFNIF